MGMSENCFLWGVQNAWMNFPAYHKERCLIYPKYQAPFLFLCYDRGRWKAFHETLASGFLYSRQKAGGQENKTIRKNINTKMWLHVKHRNAGARKSGKSGKCWSVREQQNRKEELAWRI